MSGRGAGAWLVAGPALAYAGLIHVVAYLDGGAGGAPHVTLRRMTVALVRRLPRCPCCLQDRSPLPGRMTP